MAVKKGFFFSADALLALSIILVGIFSISLIYVNDKPDEQVYLMSEDIAKILSSTSIGSINNSYVDELMLNGSISDNSTSITEQIGMFWATGKKGIAVNLAKNITSSLVPPGFGVSLIINDDLLYTNNFPTGDELISHKSLITGIEDGKPLNGSSARIYFSRVGDYKREEFTYFGGYIGQGNVTHKIYLPADFSDENFVSAHVKAEIPGDFYIYINGNLCGGLRQGLSNEVKKWDLSICNSSFVPGKNKVKLNFVSSLNESFISGGFINVEYFTNTVKDDSLNKTRYIFPEIEGLINIYDSLSSQGLIQNIKLNLTFYNEYDTFLTIGNETIFYAPGKNETQNIQINRDVLYPPIQVPLRMGITNLSNVTIVTDGKASDSILVTDVSGSMDDCGIEGEEEVTYCSYEYRFWYWWIYTDCEYSGSCSSNECGGSSTTRNHNIYTVNESVCEATFLDIAKNASKGFVDYVFDDSLAHRIGLVDYSTNGDSYTELTNTREMLHSEIDSYIANGGTCTCCAINRARMLVENSDNHKFIILMSDDEPNYACSTTDDTSGYHDTSDAEISAYEAAERVCNENITLFTIGFGDSMSEHGKQIMQDLACNESDYYDATNVEDLAAIYEQISHEIILKANYSSQTLDVVGNFTTSKIYEGSYIEMEYLPYSEKEEHGAIPLDFESDNFQGCEAQVFIPPNLDIKNAYVTSFSGNVWTKKLKVNDVFLFFLDVYNSDYSVLGDPFQIQVPAIHLVKGKLNNFSLEVGDQNNNTNCSMNNSFIYTGLIDIFNASVPYSEVLPKATGCTWNIENYFDEIMTISVPPGYAGANICNYTNSSHGQNYYDQNDSYDVAMYNFLRYLDYSNDGRVFLNFDEDDLSVNMKIIRHVPYLWGPAIAEVRVWK